MKIIMDITKLFNNIRIFYYFFCRTFIYFIFNVFDKEGNYNIYNIKIIKKLYKSRHTIIYIEYSAFLLYSGDGKIKICGGIMELMKSKYIFSYREINDLLENKYTHLFLNGKYGYITIPGKIEYPMFNKELQENFQEIIRKNKLKKILNAK